MDAFRTDDAAGVVCLGQAYTKFNEMRRSASGLCDVALVTDFGGACEHILAHRVVLAAESSYFNALFIGAGREMKQAGCSLAPPLSCTAHEECNDPCSIRQLLS